MRRTLVIVAALGVAGAGLLALAGEDGEPVFCHADGLIGPSGEVYGRDPDRGCPFVDGDGELVTTFADGEPLCYSPTMAAVPCDEPGVETRRPG